MHQITTDLAGVSGLKRDNLPMATPVLVTNFRLFPALGDGIHLISSCLQDWKWWRISPIGTQKKQTKNWQLHAPHRNLGKNGCVCVYKSLSFVKFIQKKHCTKTILLDPIFRPVPPYLLTNKNICLSFTPVADGIPQSTDLLPLRTCILNAFQLSNAFFLQTLPQAFHIMFLLLCLSTLE